MSMIIEKGGQTLKVAGQMEFWKEAYLAAYGKDMPVSWSYDVRAERAAFAADLALRELAERMPGRKASKPTEGESP